MIQNPRGIQPPSSDRAAYWWETVTREPRHVARWRTVRPRSLPGHVFRYAVLPAGERGPRGGRTVLVSVGHPRSEPVGSHRLGDRRNPGLGDVGGVMVGAGFGAAQAMIVPALTGIDRTATPSKEQVLGTVGLAGLGLVAAAMWGGGIAAAGYLGGALAMTLYRRSGAPQVPATGGT